MISRVCPKNIKIADNAVDVVKQCSITFSMLSTLEASIDVVSPAHN